MYQRRGKIYSGTLFSCCLLLLLSGCSNTSSNTQPTPLPNGTLAVSTSIPVNLAPQPTVPITDSGIAQGIVSGMTLAQKLGQMVIVEFYGSTLNGDLMAMLKNYEVSGVLIENKNGNVQTRTQLVTLNQSMQLEAHIPLFISTDFEGGIVNELRLITGERMSEAAIGATNDPQVAYNAGLHAAKDLTSLGL